MNMEPKIKKENKVKKMFSLLWENMEEIDKKILEKAQKNQSCCRGGKDNDCKGKSCCS